MNDRKDLASQKINLDILIIEDNLETIDFLTNYFELKGYSCIAVSNGKKGLEELTKIIPKVILLDILLPDMNGYDVIQQIRAKKSFKNLPVLFLTAVPRDDINKKLDELGATGIISKPFNLTDFDILSEYVK